jgi:hypothetical protein
VTWSQILTGAISGVYLVVAAVHASGGRPGLALTFFAYALANVGLIWAES